MSDKWVSVDDKIDIVHNRLKQLGRGRYDLELNFKTAEAEGREDQAEQLRTQLAEFERSIQFHEKELDKLETEKGTEVQDDSAHEH